MAKVRGIALLFVATLLVTGAGQVPAVQAGAPPPAIPINATDTITMTGNGTRNISATIPIQASNTITMTGNGTRTTSAAIPIQASGTLVMTGNR